MYTDYFGALLFFSAAISFFSFLYVLEIRQYIKAPESIYLKVFLCLHQASDPTNIRKMWLFERHASFRVLPRIGDTLDFFSGSDLEVVSEVQLRTDGMCTVWCDLTVSDDQFEQTIKKYKAVKGWYSYMSDDPKFHIHGIDGALKHRRKI